MSWQSGLGARGPPEGRQGGGSGGGLLVLVLVLLRPFRCSARSCSSQDVPPRCQQLLWGLVWPSCGRALGNAAASDGGGRRRKSGTSVIGLGGSVAPTAVAGCGGRADREATQAAEGRKTPLSLVPEIKMTGQEHV